MGESSFRPGDLAVRRGDAKSPDQFMELDQEFDSVDQAVVWFSQLTERCKTSSSTEMGIRQKIDPRKGIEFYVRVGDQEARFILCHQHVGGGESYYIVPAGISSLSTELLRGRLQDEEMEGKEA